MSTYGICQLTLIPIRKGPAEFSEMISQLLFGETYDVLSSKGSWNFIRTHFDNYEGWVDAKMTTILNNEAFETYQNTTKAYIREPIYKVTKADWQGKVSYLAGGSTVADDGSLSAILNDEVLCRFNSTIDITGMALQFLHAPYLWGGRTIFGIDCSGFTQIVYKMNGIFLPRDAYQQAAMGKTIHSLEDAAPGDLVFFENDNEHIVHTGILLDNAHLIHSSGMVHIDDVDSVGIPNPEDDGYSYFLKLIKRVI